MYIYPLSGHWNPTYVARLIASTRFGTLSLIAAGALDEWGGRRELMWELGALSYREDELPLAYAAATADLPIVSEGEAAHLEMLATGVTTGRHVMARIRPNLPAYILDSKKTQLVDPGQRVTVAGLLTIRQQPQTAKGYVFLTLEDEFDMHNVVVRPKIVTRYHRVLQSAKLLKVSGMLERQGRIVNIIADHIGLLI